MPSSFIQAKSFAITDLEDEFNPVDLPDTSGTEQPDNITMRNKWQGSIQTRSSAAI